MKFTSAKIYRGAPKGRKSMEKDWFIYYTIDGKRCQVRAGINRGQTIAERESLAQKVLKEVNQGLVDTLGAGAEKKDFLSLRDAVNWAYDSKKSRWSEKTVSDFSGVVKYFLEIAEKKGLDKSDVRSLKRVQMREIIDLMVSERKLGDHAHNKYRSVMFNLFKCLLGYEKADINPADFEGARKPKPKARVMLKKGDIKLIKEYFESENPFFLTFLRIINMMAVRPKEIFCLKVKDFDFDEGTVTLSKQFTKNKTDATIVIPKPLEPHISYLKSFPVNVYAFGYNFSPESRKEPVKRDRATKYYHDHVKIGMNIDADMYTLKHLGMRTMRQKGVSAEATQLQARHASYDESLGYAGLDRPELREELRNFPGDF